MHYRIESDNDSAGSTGHDSENNKRPRSASLDQGEEEDDVDGLNSCQNASSSSQSSASSSNSPEASLPPEDDENQHGQLGSGGAGGPGSSGIGKLSPHGSLEAGEAMQSSSATSDNQLLAPAQEGLDACINSDSGKTDSHSRGSSPQQQSPPSTALSQDSGGGSGGGGGGGNDVGGTEGGSGSPGKNITSKRVSAVDDDDGGDHAVEDDPNSSITWKPQSVQSTCEFTHVITNYAEKRETGCKKAEYSATTVDDHGNKWRLIVYVNGNGRASNHHLSLFLQVADADDLPFGWKKSVSYVLTLEHPGGSSLSYAKRNPDKTFKLCPKAIDWGWSQFITSDRIQQEGFVSEDCLTVRASVTVKSSSVSIDEEDAELYLKYAVEEGDAKAVKLCLEQGASVNCKFKDDLYTPLHTACSSSGTTNTSASSSANNNSNNAAADNNNNNTGKGSSIEVLSLLLSEGADANACNKWRETPLLIAANNGNFPACEALLEHGADPSLCSEAGWSALTFAAHKGFDDIVKLLLKKGAPVNTRVAEDNSTPLHKACAGSKPGHLAAVRLLLVCQADVHALNKWRETPLLTAANHGQAGAVELLLAAGADPCKCTDTGWSPLSIAAYKGHDDVVRLLLEEGAPTEEEDPTLSALLQAATKGLPDTVDLLLRNGADHTVTTKKGDTALSILVEQNLIDAAVDMVTNYSASIPRCSRDRKKVQRARLLINLRMKQMERENKNGVGGSTDEDDETDDDESVGPHSAQHQEDGSQAITDSKSMPKKKKRGKGGDPPPAMSAEERARAAEEALLLELEQEDAKAKKEEAEANSKRAKKKKKKERERQQKLKEEQERKAREEREAKEKERIRKEKEEKMRKEQEIKLKEQQEREIKEMMEREKALAAKRKERERREREQKKHQEKNPSQPVSPSGSDASEKQTKSTNSKAGKSPTVSTSSNTNTKSSSGSSNKSNPELNNGPTKKPAVANNKNSKVAPLSGNRRWETKSKSPLRPTPAPQQQNTNVNTQQAAASRTSAEQMPPLPRSASAPSGTRELPAAPSSFLSPRPRSSSSNETSPSFLAAADENPGATPQVPPAEAMQGNETNSQATRHSSIEHPAITLFRREKVAEMVQRCSLALTYGETIVKRVLSRWMVRAAHEKTPYIDPLIPSWTDSDKLIAFFQRQFITESRRVGVDSGMNLEALKEAGTSAALICQALANELEELRQRVDSHLPPEWSDSALGMTTSEAILNDARCVSISWANRATIDVPAVTLATLQDRYFGPTNRFLTAVFVAKLWYETKDQLMADTGMDVRLPASTQACLSSELSVSAELWSDPFNSYCTNVFWGNFEEVDRFFGGQSPFGKDELGGENVIACHGGSVSVMPPLDNMIASRYVQRMLDVLAAADAASKPVSFALFLHADCFHDLPNGPSPDDLHLLDPRLGKPKLEYIQHIEVIPAGQHFFKCESAPGNAKICASSSLLVFLQNQSGKSRFNINNGCIARIVGSMSAGLSRNDNLVTPLGFPVDFALTENSGTPQQNYFEGPLSPDPQRIISSEFGAIGGSALPIPFSPANEQIPRNSRPGRLFDLVDNGEDDQVNDVDLVSGMLNNLDVGLFQNGNVSGSDVDIEAISLMGIGGPPPMHSSRSGSAQTGMGRFG